MMSSRAAALLRVAYGISLLFIVMTPLRPVAAAGLSETLEQVDTGPFKDAACRSGIEAMVGTVDGLGIAAFSLSSFCFSISNLFSSL